MPSPRPGTGMPAVRQHSPQAWLFCLPLCTPQAPWEARKRQLPQRLVLQPLSLTSSFPSVLWDYWGSLRNAEGSSQGPARMEEKTTAFIISFLFIYSFTQSQSQDCTERKLWNVQREWGWGSQAHFLAWASSHQVVMGKSTGQRVQRSDSSSCSANISQYSLR